MVGQKTAAEVATDDVETATARFAYETRWAGQQGTAREKCDGFATATLPVRGMARGGSKPTPACECPRQQAAAHTQADATGLAAAAMTNMQHAPITCCSQVAR